MAFGLRSDSCGVCWVVTKNISVSLLSSDTPSLLSVSFLFKFFVWFFWIRNLIFAIFSSPTPSPSRLFYLADFFWNSTPICRSIQTSQPRLDNARSHRESEWSVSNLSCLVSIGSDQLKLNVTLIRVCLDLRFRSHEKQVHIQICNWRRDQQQQQQQREEELRHLRY